ncbi:hypothetical protein BCEP4_820015 [Burkholderia cepacia]|nr:hypothetical protein BCEP4_820015 [Burkholderia cepacia]
MARDPALPCTRAGGDRAAGAREGGGHLGAVAAHGHRRRFRPCGRAARRVAGAAAAARVRDRTRAVEAGFRAYLTRPAVAADLIAALRALAFSPGESHAEPFPPDARHVDRPTRR